METRLTEDVVDNKLLEESTFRNNLGYYEKLILDYESEIKSSGVHEPGMEKAKGLIEKARTALDEGNTAFAYWCLGLTQGILWSMGELSFPYLDS